MLLSKRINTVLEDYRNWYGGSLSKDQIKSYDDMLIRDLIALETAYELLKNGAKKVENE